MHVGWITSLMLSLMFDNMGEQREAVATDGYDIRVISGSCTVPIQQRFANHTKAGHTLRVHNAIDHNLR